EKHHEQSPPSLRERGRWEGRIRCVALDCRGWVRGGRATQCNEMQRNGPLTPGPSPGFAGEGSKAGGRRLQVVVLAVVFVLVVGDVAARGAGVPLDDELLCNRLAGRGQYDAVRAGRGGSAPEAAAEAAPAAATTATALAAAALPGLGGAFLTRAASATRARTA